MKNWLNSIRTPNTAGKLSTKVLISLGFLILGSILGIFAKWLDTVTINDSIWWRHLIGSLDLSGIFSDFNVWVLFAVTIAVFSKTPIRAAINVLLFFLGMNISYHIYTIEICGFNPRNYMMIWYAMTLITPLLAYVCWYARSNHPLSIIISAGILGVMAHFSFNIGLWYFSFRNILDTLFFVLAIAVLYINPKNTAISLLGASVLALMINLDVVRLGHF